MKTTTRRIVVFKQNGTITQLWPVGSQPFQDVHHNMHHQTWWGPGWILTPMSTSPAPSYPTLPGFRFQLATAYQKVSNRWFFSSIFACTKFLAKKTFRGAWLVTNSQSLPGFSELSHFTPRLLGYQPPTKMAEKHTPHVRQKVGKHTPLCKSPAVKHCRFATNRSSNRNEPPKKDEWILRSHVPIQKDVNCHKNMSLTMQCICQIQQKKIPAALLMNSTPQKKWLQKINCLLSVL